LLEVAAPIVYIDNGSYTPLEKHAHEHEFSCFGEVLVQGKDQEAVVKPGNVNFVPSFEEHGQ